MPTSSTAQTQMDRYMGQVPALDSNSVIDNISYKRNVVAKTSDYTVKAWESGTLFTSIGATAAVTFTLPANADGLEFWFMSAAATKITVTADAVNTMVTFNNAAADSVEFAASNEIIGSGFVAIADGDWWHVFTLASNGGSISASLTVTDA